MPIYEYQCPQCQNIFEEWLNIKDTTATAPCPECASTAQRIISNTAFVLKGGGWYVTEYGNRKNSSTQSDTSKSATTNAAKSAADSKSLESKGTENTGTATTTATPTVSSSASSTSPVASKSAQA